jgi:hypothetical protein
MLTSTRSSVDRPDATAMRGSSSIPCSPHLFVSCSGAFAARPASGAVQRVGYSLDYSHAGMMMILDRLLFGAWHMPSSFRARGGRAPSLIAPARRWLLPLLSLLLSAASEKRFVSGL